LMLSYHIFIHYHIINCSLKYSIYLTTRLKCLLIDLIV
jgi:hypothetical protein